jgi:hypothetical protein
MRAPSGRMIVPTCSLPIAQSLDASAQGLTNEVRALHGQIGRFANRLQRIEAKDHA